METDMRDKNDLFIDSGMPAILIWLAAGWFLLINKTAD